MELTHSPPKSCDTFVCLPPSTKPEGSVIFGKNSDRPAGEVQEIVYLPKTSYGIGAKLKCTYIEIDQVTETAAVILSKPSWMWGAEMGSNQYGVCIGNEAVWTKLEASIDKALLGMDLVRLGLERSKTALEALKIITELLEKHGQGGPCSDTMKNFTYHNSFLIADVKEAWVLETAGKFWAAEHITSGFRHISNSLSIGTKIDMSSLGLIEEAEGLGFWKKGKGNNSKDKEFNFTKVFSDAGGLNESERVLGGRKLLENSTKDNQFDVRSMMNILRDEESGICMSYDDSFQSTSSQVSLLLPNSTAARSNNSADNNAPTLIHWFTGTPDPKVSIFKPFIFPKTTTNSFQFTTATISPEVIDQSSRKPDRRHALYKAHEKAYHSKMSHPKYGETTILGLMKKLEMRLIEQLTPEISSRKSNPSSNKSSSCADDDDQDGLSFIVEGESHLLFNNAVQSELDLYTS